MTAAEYVHYLEAAFRSGRKSLLEDEIDDWNEELWHTAFTHEAAMRDEAPGGEINSLWSIAHRETRQIERLREKLGAT